MKEKISDLIYTARSLCEALHDRTDLLDYDEELRDYVEELETAVDAVGELEDVEDTDE